MNISEETLARIEEKLREIAELDPADLPEPASDLVAMLGEILDQVENS